MAFCSKCGSEIPEGATFCSSCGSPVGSAGTAQSVNYVNEFDHTSEYDAKDISDNKVFAMLSYLMPPIGALFTYLGAKDSPYAMFHAKQSLNMTVIMIIVSFLTALLCWTCIVPVAGGIFLAVLFVVDIIAIVNVAKGLAIEMPIVRGIKFLK